MQKLLENQRIRIILGIIVVVSFLFQIGHFAEHIFQVYMWTFVDHTKFWMSPLAIYIEHAIGGTLFPNGNHWLPLQNVMMYQMNVGKEIMHFTGDIIFLSGIISFFLLTKTRAMKWALGFQLFHTYEHISLLMSSFFLGVGYGFSTLFGAPVPLTILYGYRAYWHFIFNLIPMVLIGYTLYHVWKIRVAEESQPATIYGVLRQAGFVRRALLWGALFAVAAIVIAIGVWKFLAPIHEPAPDHANIVLTEAGWIPGEVTIKMHGSVTFSTKRNKPFWPASDPHPSHDIYPELDSKKPINPDDTWTFVFDKIGDWGFHDHLRSYFVGTIHVVE